MDIQSTTKESVDTLLKRMDPKQSNMADPAQKEMGKDEFLLLLVTQLRHQDPLSPMENTEFVSQLAQFRQLEGTGNVEDAIEKLGDSYESTLDAQKDSAQSMSTSSAVSMIGKQIRIRQKSVELGAGAQMPVPIRVHLGNQQEATVEIVEKNVKQEDGSVEDVVRRTLTTEGKGADNSAVVHWDGRTDSGERLFSGKYEIRIEGQKVNPNLYAFAQGAVDGVRFVDDGALISVGGKELPLTDVMSVSVAQDTPRFGELSGDNALSLLGRNVHVSQNVVSTPGLRMDHEGNPMEIDIPLKVNMAGYSSTKVHIVDQSGTIVDTISVDSSDIVNDVATVHWDGRLGDGSQEYADPGTYAVVIADQSRNPHMYAFREGTVESIRTAGGQTMIEVNGAFVPLSQVLEVGVADNQEVDV